MAFQQTTNKEFGQSGSTGGLPKSSVGKGDPRFHALLKEIGALHDLKQCDYGTDADPFANVRAAEDFGIPGWLGAIIRANDKMKRLKTYAKTQVLRNEGVRDAFMDMAVYSLIALILFDEKRPKVEVKQGPYCDCGELPEFRLDENNCDVRYYCSWCAEKEPTSKVAMMTSMDKL